MNDNDGQNISVGWYIAFFLLGILLGLWVLSSLEPGNDSFPTQGSRVSEPDSDEEKSSKSSGNTVNASPGVSGLNGKASAESPLTPEIKEPVICDQKNAREIRNKAREVAEITVKDDRVTVLMRSEWSYFSDSVRRSFVEQFSESDSCLNGRSRQILVYYEGKLFATADEKHGITFE